MPDSRITENTITVTIDNYPVKHPITGVGAVVIHNNSIFLIKCSKEPYAGKWLSPGKKIKWAESL